MDWQTTIVVTVIALAMAYLGRLAWLSIVARKAAACGGCDRCATSKAGEGQAIVGIDRLSASANQALSASANGSTSRDGVER